MARKKKPARKKPTRAWFYVGDLLVLVGTIAFIAPSHTQKLADGEYKEFFLGLPAAMVHNLINDPLDFVWAAAILIIGLTIMSQVRKKVAGRLRVGDMVAF